MNVLLLGNGFDLYHNLLTSYDDFITVGMHLVKKYPSYNFKETNTYSELKELSECSEPIKTSLSMYEDAYSITNINPEEYSVLIELLHTNSWFKYFSDIKERGGWVYLESQIAKVLKIAKESGIGSIAPFAEVIKSNAGYTDPVFKHIKRYVYHDETIFNEYENFIKLLKLYLKIFVNNVLFNISRLYNFENTFLTNCNHVISFNYTDTYKLLYSQTANIAHLHGNLKEEIVVGVNSDESDNIGTTDSLFIRYKKYYQRITKHTFNGIKNLITSLESSTIKKHLKVVGHSLDIADEDIITVIFNWFDTITIYYHSDSSLDKYVKNLQIIFGAKKISEMTFSQKITFEQLPPNNLTKAKINN